jgi:alkanesulfonate monooxygenase SsuD/methylene tetrahydromethanopterin reductase-like flavin-dependent oxidoreductase (luciferase family)
LAAKHGDVINIISDAGKPGYIKLENVRKLTNDAFHAKVQFVREEAKRHRRDGGNIQISNVIFSVIVTDSPAATQSMAEGMAPMFGTTPEGLLQSPMALVGTPEQCIAELKRRQREWDVTHVIFSGALGESGLRRLAEQVLPHV